MKIRLTAAIALIIITLLISTVLFSVTANTDNSDAQLILKENNGYATLFKGNEIITVYDEIVISVLPKSDREQLKNGIVIKSEEQLNSIIEDYDG